MHFQDVAFALFVSGAFAAPAALIARDSCSDACADAYSTCRSAPDANRASCASDYATCLGYNPFSGGSLVTPTACSKSVASSTAASSVAPSATADACVSTCNASYDSCRSAPGANRSTCASEYASCLGYSPYGSDGSLITPTACSQSVASTTPAPTTTQASAAPATTTDACVSTCNASYNSCRSAPGANRSTCASEYASCLGYSPYGSDGSLITPTACSQSVASSTASATATSVAAPATTADACISTCNTSYDSCRSAPNANRATCAAEYASCLGYNPFNGGSLVTPTACSSIAVSTSTAPSSTVTQVVQASSTGSPVQVSGAEWTIKQLVRYCSADGSGCDYNFAISTNDGSADERCTVSRTPGKDATTESFYGIPCTTGSANTISWGISDQFGADSAFAVLTVTNNDEKANAYFGVANVNSNEVTASSPAGSGNFGDIGPEPVYYF